MFSLGALKNKLFKRWRSPKKPATPVGSLQATPSSASEPQPPALATPVPPSTPRPPQIKLLLPPQINPQDLEVCRQFCQQLIQGNQQHLILQSRWQQYYAQLSDRLKVVVWHYANQYLPSIKLGKKTQSSKNSINLFWQRIFCNQDNLKRLARGCQTGIQTGYGLVYCYLINGKVRYIGQTREQSLRKRMLRKRQDGQIGYNYAMRCKLLNAYRTGVLSIKTHLVALPHLNAYEQGLIKHYAPTNRLWNIEHNAHFNVKNYNV